MPRYIDADALKSNILKRLGIKAECYLLYQERLVWNVIGAQPTADVVEVVRCRECRFSEEVNPGLYICHNENIKIVGSYVAPDWYCADGKRKETKDE